MVSLIMAFIALACTVIPYTPLSSTLPWVGFLGLLFSIIAVATGSKTLKIDPADKAARAGKTIGVIILVLAIIGIVLSIVAILGIASLFV